MSKLLIRGIFTYSFLLLVSIWSGCVHLTKDPKPEIGFLRVSSEIEVRRLFVHNSRAKGTVLFLHGFPETLYAWKEISVVLGRDYEVHAFDWPGYGLSSRPSADNFSYSPKDYADILKAYIRQSGINTSNLVIYATDIGALPALLLAMEEPDIARKLIVGDFAPFDRPQYMYESLQSLKSKPSSDRTRDVMNKNRDEILENAFRRGLPKEEQFEVLKEFKDDMFRGWSQSNITSADAFYHYYSHFTRDQDYFESNLTKLKTPVKVIWGEKDIYIRKEMGIEFAKKARLEFVLLSNLGHYPHLQSPKQTIEEIHSSFNER